MSEAFSQSPPVYANTGASAIIQHHIQQIQHRCQCHQEESTSYSYPYGYPQTQIPQDVYRESIQSAVLIKFEIA